MASCRIPLADILAAGKLSSLDSPIKSTAKWAAMFQLAARCMECLMQDTLWRLVNSRSRGS